MKILNLYSGVGGNRKLWGDEHEITSVELRADVAAIYKQNFPNDELIIGDAHEFLLEHYEEYDFIWSSPPCQSHSLMAISGKNKTPQYPDMKLYQEVIFLDQHYEGKWVVENVKSYYKPLIPYKTIGRHCFWTNFGFLQFEPSPEPKNFIMLTNTAGRKKMQEWLGIHYDKNVYYDGNHCPVQIYRNAVHPEIGQFLLEEAFLDRAVWDF